jgi:type IX secretion system PorP/SprF family membrane protein
MKTNYKILFVTLTLLVGSLRFVAAQQDPAYSQYMFNSLLINPAYAGSRDVLNLSALYRHQWVNIEGAPRTITFAADAPMFNEKIGLGVIANYDQIGYTTTTGIFGQLAYRLRFSKKGTLSFGASFGAQQYSIDMRNLNYKIPGQTAADATFDNNVSKWNPNIGLGLYYATDKAYIGLSAPHVLNNNLNNTSFGISLKENSGSASQYRHYMLAAGFVSHISSAWIIKPSTLIKAVSGAPLQFDINANFWYYDFIGFGVSYRTTDALVGMIELQLNPEIRIGYAYDYSTNGLNSFNYGSHEIMLRYELGARKSKMLTPRYF